MALAVLLTAPIVQDMKAQQASRQALTAAIWDRHSVRIDGYPIGVDRAERDGHVYSDKAPGQSVFAVPAYAAYRALGGEPATVLRVEGNLGLWATSVWSSSMPFAVLLVLVRRTAQRVDASVVIAVTATTGVATLLLPFSSLLFGHLLGAVLGFAGWYLVGRSTPGDRALAASGALLGAAVLTEYTMVLAASAVAIHVAWTCRLRAWRFLAGAVPSLIALLAYQWVAFGGPFAFSYSRSSFGPASRELGLTDQDPSLLDNAIRVLVGERGLFVVTPVVAAAMLGAVILVRRSVGFDRSAHLAAAASAASLIGVQVFWSNPTGGDSPGPRYATAAAAFLVPGLAVAWGRWRRCTTVLAAIGGLIMVASTWTNPLEARDSRNAVGIWLGRLFRGEWSLTIYEMALGSWARVLLPLGAVGGAIVLARVRVPAHVERRAAR